MADALSKFFETGDSQNFQTYGSCVTKLSQRMTHVYTCIEYMHVVGR